jgi:methyl-accepting chemotaxis protein
MLERKSRLKGLNGRIVLLVTVTCVAVVALCCGVSIYQYFRFFETSINEHSASLYANFDRLAKDEVETATSVLKGVYESQQKGEITADQAKKLGADLLRGLRYGQDGYFWADTTQGVNVVLLGKDTEGKSRIDAQDKKGNYYVKDFVGNGTKEGGGYTDYWFTKKDGTVPFPKRSYTLEFKPFGWVVGTGNYTDDIQTLIAKEQAALRQKLFSSIILMIILTVVGLGGALFVALKFSAGIMRQLGGEPEYIAGIARKIAEGDLTMTFEGASSDTGVLGAMKSMTARLNGILGEIKAASVNLASGSEQLSSTSEQISRDMTQQSSRASQIASAATEMSQTVVDIAHNTSSMAGSTEQTVEVAKEGETTVGLSVTEVKEIAETVNESAGAIRSLGDQSKQIGEIVSVINDIADQTNLLALNAAIEAARAGEQGRGFAVVADEVRKLAERTAKATSEIRAMISTIQAEVEGAVHSMDKVTKKVERGVVLSTKAGTTLTDVVGSITALQSMVVQIASATEELSSVSNAISDDVEGVASSAKDTSSGAEQIAQSSSELARLAVTLEGIVGQFKV